MLCRDRPAGGDVTQLTGISMFIIIIKTLLTTQEDHTFLCNTLLSTRGERQDDPNTFDSNSYLKTGGDYIFHIMFD
jgi:hypothetical protein